MDIRITCFLLLFWISTGVCFAQGATAQPPAESQKKEEIRDYAFWDYGRIKAGPIYKHYFEFTNETKGVLHINDVSASCGCTVPELRKYVLRPGEKTTLTVSFKSMGTSGDVVEHVFLSTDDPKNPIVRFKIEAEVIR